MLCVHLAVGIGFYHHLILKVQLEYNLDLVGTIDFAFMQNETGSNVSPTCVLYHMSIKKYITF